jgi:hypothetical protein
VLQPCVVFTCSMVLWMFHNSTFLWNGVISPMPNSRPVGPGTTFHLAPQLWSVWHGSPYTLASLVHHVTGTCKPPLHDKAAVLEEAYIFHIHSFIYCNIPSIPSRLQNTPNGHRTSHSSYIHMLYKKA